MLLLIAYLLLQEIWLVPQRVKRTKRRRGISVNAPIVDVACGSYASYAVDDQGHTWAWGLNNYGQLGNEGEVQLQLLALLFTYEQQGQIVPPCYP